MTLAVCVDCRGLGWILGQGSRSMRTEPPKGQLNSICDSIGTDVWDAPSLCCSAAVPTLLRLHRHRGQGLPLLTLWPVSWDLCRDTGQEREGGLCRAAGLAGAV